MHAPDAPAPLPDLASRPLPRQLLPAGTVLYRIHHSEREAIWFGPAAGTSPLFRFDSPDGSYRVCYLGLSPDASFAETLLRRPGRRLLPIAELEVRVLTEIEVLRDLTLVPLHGEGLVRLGATAEITATRDYALSQSWSGALWVHPEQADGIVYRCRHDDSLFAAALFDRAADVLRSGRSAVLHGEGKLIGWLARRYGFGLTL